MGVTLAFWLFCLTPPVDGHDPCLGHAAGASCAGGCSAKDVRSNFLLQTFSSSTKKHTGEGDSVDVCVLRSGRCLNLTVGSRSVPEETRTYRQEELLISVTRAGEDLRWLDAVPDMPTLVYDRFGAKELLPRPRANLVIKQVENSGREDDSMLRHIIASYEDLSDVTIFLQGWPLAHCSNLVQTLREVAAYVHTPRSVDYERRGALPGLVPLSYTFYQFNVSDGLLGQFRQIVEDQTVPNRTVSASEKAKHLFSDMCSHVFQKECPTTMWFAEGAQWAVSKERIRGRPKEFYQRALDVGEGFDGKLRGYVLEALWPFVFGEPDWRPPAAMRRSHEPSGPDLAVAYSGGGHCSLGTDGARLLSCEKRLGYCRLEWHEQDSEQALDGAILTRTMPAEYWSMDIELQRMPYEASARPSIVFASHSLIPSLNETARHDCLSLKPGVCGDLRFKMLDAPGAAKGQYLFAQHPGPRFLGCSKGVAHVSNTPTTWRVVAQDFGLVSLHSASGILHHRRTGDGRLLCNPAESAVGDVTFMLAAIS